MPEHALNVLLSSFPGLGLPQTLSIPTPASTSIADLISHIHSLIPPVDSRLIFTTSRNKELLPSSTSPISTLVPNNEALLPLRLSVPLCGGKGGFGSQLRAAGGRMSSKKKRNQGEQNGSSRNLDGRRLRTVNAAKALAEYLATKPEMDRKQKEAQRKRWEQVVEAAERREEELKRGSKGRVDGQWVEDKEEAGERTREAVNTAMASGNYKDVIFRKEEGEESGSTGDEESRDQSTGEVSSPSTSISPEKVDYKGKGKAKAAPKAYFGWDEDDEFMSEDEQNKGDEAPLEEATSGEVNESTAVSA